MKYAKQMLALALTLLPALAAAQLHSGERILAQVPFEFMVANKPVPAGEYIVQPVTMDGRTLVIRNTTARLGMFSQAALSEGRKTAAYTLVFHKYGAQYLLVYRQLRLNEQYGDILRKLRNRTDQVTYLKSNGQQQASSFLALRSQRSL